MVRMSEKDSVKIETRVLDEQSRVMMVTINGYVDQANSHLLQKVIDHCIADKYYSLVFNLQNLVYMSSAGWGVLIGEIKRFRENGGDIKLANMGPEIYEIYQMLEFYHIISEYGSVDEAVKSFSGKKMEVQDTKPPTTTVQRTYQEPKETDIPESNGDAKPEYSPSESEEMVISEEEIDINIDGILASEGIVKSGGEDNRAGYVEFDLGKFEKEPDMKIRPVQDKIRDIISKHPEYGFFKIKKALDAEEYSHVKIGIFKLRSILKALELDTKEKRYRFFLSA